MINGLKELSIKAIHKLSFMRFPMRSALLLLITILFVSPAQATPLPNPDLNPPSAAKIENIVLAGGCFWGVEAVFEHLKGVKNVVSGYAGGTKETADYNEVSRGATGHAEAVKITYDPAEISLGQLLQVFFSVAHNPTELNRQGPDHGTQYRTAIFPANAEQQKVAEAYIAQLTKAKAFSSPIVTTLEPLKEFYPAEAYHQDFMKKNPKHPYILIHDAPKVAAVEKEFPGLYKKP